MAGHGDRGLLADHGVFREHAVEVGAEPVRQVIGADRAAIPTRVESADDSVPDRETFGVISDSRDFACAVAERCDTELRRSPSTALQHHQVAVVERSRVDPQENFPGAGPRIVARHPNTTPSTLPKLSMR
jgi:hypothetical protein